MRWFEFLVFKRKRSCFAPDTTIDRPHYNADERSPKTEPFENALQCGAIWKRCFLKTLFLVWTEKTMLSEKGDVIKIDTTGRQTTRPWVSKIVDRRYHVASISRQFRGPMYWNAHASSSFEHAPEGIKAFSKRKRCCSEDGWKRYEKDVWTQNIFENGAKPLRFRLKTDLCGRGLKRRILCAEYNCWARAKSHSQIPIQVFLQCS